MPGGLRRSAARLTTVLTAGAVGLGLAIVPGPSASAVPTFTATTVVSGLEIPWDLTWIGSRMLYTLRKGEVWAKDGSAEPQRILDLRSQTVASGEGGLLGMVADPAAASNRTFYTCGTYKSGNTNVDVRVRRWQLNTSGTGASDQGVVLAGLPLTSGRHSGCRLRFGYDGKLYVGTGDAAGYTNPQNLDSLGGKVLRIDGCTGTGTLNPYCSRGGNARHIWTYGHRNIQGLALRPGTSQLWSAEHGSSRDDEINFISRGGNYGWDPGPGYDESVPMTDTDKFPNARRAKWSSGSPTVATSGLTFLTGPAWGRWQGAMAVGLLKDQGILILTLDPGGAVARTERLAAADGYGRIRAVQTGPDGALYFTTSNGTNDRIVRLTPSPARPLQPPSPGLDVSPVGVAATRTGNTFYLYGRSPAGNIYFRRSNDDARSWGPWTGAGVASTSAPAVTSSAPGRIDLFTRSSASTVVHTWFVNGTRRGQVDLGGNITAAPAVTSAEQGKLDLFVRGGDPYGAARRHYDGNSWSGWQQLGGVFSSALGASANRTTKAITVTGRGSGGGGYQRVISPTSSTGWRSTGFPLWSARALGDTATGIGLVGVSSGSDTNAVVDRGALIQGVSAVYTSVPAVVTRADGTWIMFGRSTSNGVYAYDARPGGYRNIALGGTLG